MAKIALYHKKKLTENICRGKIFFVSLQSQKKKKITIKNYNYLL